MLETLCLPVERQSVVVLIQTGLGNRRLVINQGLWITAITRCRSDADISLNTKELSCIQAGLPWKPGSDLRPIVRACTITDARRRSSRRWALKFAVSAVSVVLLVAMLVLVFCLHSSLQQYLSHCAIACFVLQQSQDPRI